MASQQENAEVKKVSLSHLSKWMEAAKFQQVKLLANKLSYGAYDMNFRPKIQVEMEIINQDRINDLVKSTRDEIINGLNHRADGKITTDDVANITKRSNDLKLSFKIKNGKSKMNCETIGNSRTNFENNTVGINEQMLALSDQDVRQALGHEMTHHHDMCRMSLSKVSNQGQMDLLYPDELKKIAN